MTDREFERYQTLLALKSMCFSDSIFYGWTFANYNGKNPNISRAKCYVDRWQEMLSDNIGLLLWGDVGTGKSYFAACIANALVEQAVSVKMTNFVAVLNELFDYKDKNEYISRLNECNLLIIDDLGIERNTEYALEQVYNIIGARYKIGKPLIITTNMSLTELKNPPDTAHKRIYDRILEICVPIRFNGENMRTAKAKSKLKKAADLLDTEV